MELGDKVFFLDTDGCFAIREGVITQITEVYRYIDFLSSRSQKTERLVWYSVCAMKNGSYYYFEPSNIFCSIEQVKAHLGEVEFNKYFHKKTNKATGN